MTVIDDNRFYKMSEVAKITGISQFMLAKYAREGRLNATRTGKLWRMSGEAVKEFLKNGTIEKKDSEV